MADCVPSEGGGKQCRGPASQERPGPPWRSEKGSPRWEQYSSAETQVENELGQWGPLEIISPGGRETQTDIPMVLTPWKGGFESG